MPTPIEEEPSSPPSSSSSSSSSDNDFPRPPALPNYFAPPFYGRPGTPLPPSPSITSLLIPSRPTTPDLSDAEDEEARGGPAAPRKAPQVPTYEYYGFVLYLVSSLTFAVYLLWSYLPSPFLHALGIEYYPNRWWSLAVPAWVTVALVWIFVALGSYNVGYLTPRVGSIETVVDDAGFVAAVAAAADGKAGRKKGGRKERVDYREVWGQATDGVMDVPLGGVCEILHVAGGVEEAEDGEEERSWFWGLLEL